jgi:protein PsiE
MRVMSSMERAGLAVIAIATVIAAGQEVAVMVGARVVTLGDLLLMFLYLEVLSMVSHYFSSGRMPVRYPLYIGMVALARYLILEMKEMDGPRILMITAAILVLAFAVLVVRYGHLRFPYPPEE